MRVQLGLSASVLLGCSVFACGSDGSGPETSAQSPDPEAESPPQKPGDEPPPVVEKRPDELLHVLAGFDRFSGYLHPSSKRVFSLPTTLVSSLSRVTAAKIDGVKIEVQTLAVKGDVPTGRIEGMTYEPASERFILLVRLQRPHRIELVSVALGVADATFASLSQVSAPPPEAATYQSLRARGGGVVVAQGGARAVKIAITKTTATWGSFESAGGLVWGNNTTYAYDAPRARLVALGREWHNPATKQLEYRPVIGTASLDGPYVLQEESFSLGPNALKLGNPVTWSAWDATGERLLAAIQVNVPCGVSECVELETWSADLASGTWTPLPDRRPPGGRTPFVVDDEARRAYSLVEGSLSAVRLDDPSPLEKVPLVQEGDLGPIATDTAVALASGKILTTGRGFFRVLDPSAPSPRWERLAAKLPTSDEWRGSYAEDPATGDVFLFGGDPSGDPIFQVLSKDGAILTPLPAEDGPFARTGHGSIFAGGTLVVAGGTRIAATGILDDVWSFDRTAGTWKKLGSLPQALAQVKLNAVSSSEVWALGYTLSGQVDLEQGPVVAIDLATGKSRALAAKGEKPPRLWAIAPLGSCFVGYESGEMLDDGEPQLWRCEKDADGIRWERKPVDAHDEGLDRSAGVGAPDGSRAYFVGQHIWRVDAKK